MEIMYGCVEEERKVFVVRLVLELMDEGVIERLKSKFCDLLFCVEGDCSEEGDVLFIV